MRFACGDMRDHIVSYQNDHRPSYWRRRALRQQARLRIDFSEILRVVRFSTFATISARNGHADSVPQCPLSGAKQKTCARIVAPELRSGRAWVRSKRLVIWKNDGLLRL